MLQGNGQVVIWLGSFQEHKLVEHKLKKLPRRRLGFQGIIPEEEDLKVPPMKMKRGQFYAPVKQMQDISNHILFVVSVICIF